MTSGAAQSRRFAMPGAILLFLIVYALTVTQTTGDTPVYADDILRYFQGTASGRELWEFGHLFWRPLGLGIWRAIQPIASTWFGGNPLLQINAVLFAVVLISTIALIPLCFFLCVRLGLRDLRAWAVTTGLLLCATVLNYVHSGSAYNPGLAFNLAGQILLLDAFRGDKFSAPRALGGGLALALSAAIWFPYILSLPAAFLIAWLAAGSLPQRERLRRLYLSIAFTAAAGLLLFGLGAWGAGISSPQLLKQWISGSAHGMQQSRQIVRLPTGVTRSFFYFGDDGLLMKRFVFGDPYAPVRWYDLLTAGLWKMVLVFATLAALIGTLARRREGWNGLAIVAAGFLPTLFFALFLFETSEPSRYETLYPALIAGICAVLSATWPARAARSLLAVFLVAMALVNLRAFGWDLRGAAASSSARVHLVQGHIQNHGIALLVSFRDPLSTYFQRDPFVPEDRQHALPFFHVIEPGAARVLTWRKDASCRVLQAWKEGGEAWLSVRLLASRPEPDWDWAEHDDNRVHWSDLPAFFTQLDSDEATGNSDGFVRVAENAKNRAFLERACGPT